MAGLGMFWIVLVAVAVLAVAASLYARAAESRLQMRRFNTTVGPKQLRDIFARSVATAGWSIVERGNPMVAGSPIITGRRQRIHLSIRDGGHGTYDVELGPTRVILAGPIFRVPLKPYTLHLRLTNFMRAVRRVDPTIEVTRTPRPVPTGSSSWL